MLTENESKMHYVGAIICVLFAIAFFAGCGVLAKQDNTAGAAVTGILGGISVIIFGVLAYRLHQSQLSTVGRSISTSFVPQSGNLPDNYNPLGRNAVNLQNPNIRHGTNTQNRLPPISNTGMNLTGVQEWANSTQVRPT